MPTPLSTVLGSARRVTYVLTASNASFPIPSWAQGGKGIAIVTACGGGAGGGNRVAATVSGGIGSPAIIGYPVPIPSGVTTVNAQVAAGGAGAAASTDTNGAAGGETTLTVGSRTLRISAANGFLPDTVTSGGAFSGLQGTAVTSGDWTFISSGTAGTSNSVGGNQGAGGRSPFGVGGSGWTSTQTNTAGDPAKGYGAGGGIGYGTGKGGDGAPGVLILEFVEGL